MAVTGQDPETFGGLLRRLRRAARLTQEELAEAATLSPRSVSDLERGVAVTPQRETVRLLADALGLVGPARAAFEAAARGRAEVSPLVAGGGAAAATRTLPRDISSFTGRDGELGELVGAAAGTVVGIHAIGGMAGVGKTAFAVHAAHRLAPRFPDGQVFLSLHGHTPGQQPVDAAGALASLLATIGVDARQIPSGLEARMGLWRDRLAGRELLLVLDDAASSEQVQPLLPGAGGCLVLVTSRRRLTALDDARAISLDTLAPEEAAALLVRLAARPGLDPGDPAVAQITELCGYLPLAIGMLARQLHHHPAWTPADLAADLAASRDRLELMHTEDLSVAAAFDLSYRDLAPGQQRMFRRLGLHLGPDIDAFAAAALDDDALTAARRVLEALYGQYLIAEPARGRYRFHDLIREHARALAATDAQDDQDAATSRLLDYYQHAAALAEARLARQTRPGPPPPAPGTPPAAPDLADVGQALAWARAERASLLAWLDHAARTGQHARVIALTAGLAGLLGRDGPPAEAITRHTTAIQATRRLGDQLAEANALADLAIVRRLTGDYPDAAQAEEQALEIYRDLGDRTGEANALSELGALRLMAGDYPGSAEMLEQALETYRDLGDRTGEASVLRQVGTGRLARGDYPGAAQVLEQALGIYRDLGDQLGEANALSYLGAVRWLEADYPGAAQVLQEALGIHRDLGDRLGEANAFYYLGAVRRQEGDYPGAAHVLEQALEIYRDLGSRGGEANALSYLGVVRRQEGDYPGAAHVLGQALEICRGLGYRIGEAIALFYLGSVRRMTGDYPGAAQMVERALEMCRDLGDRGGEAEMLNERGTLHRLTGDLAQAKECHQQALELGREVGSTWEEAQALAGLGRCALAAGGTADAQAHLRQAQEIFERIGAAAETAGVSAELDALTKAGPAASGP